MAVKKVFLTGATGYIGGDALFALQQAQPEWDVSVLVRDEKRGSDIQRVFPNIKFVVGSLDDFNIVKDAASKADIIVHTADSSDHQGAAQAIIDGLRATHSRASPGYYIHIGGTGILVWYDEQNERIGEAPLPEQAYDDVDGIEAVLNLPDCAFHRDVDKIVLAAAGEDPEAVKIAIVCPPTIYGPGRGPVNQISRQIPAMITQTLVDGVGPFIGAGLSEWDNIHVQDLSALTVLLAQQSLSVGTCKDEHEIWGPKAYYFVENGIHRWSEMAKVAAKAAHEQNLIQSIETKQFPTEEAKRLGFEWLSWGYNSRGAAKRARKYLGWEPKNPTLAEAIPDMVRAVAARRK